MVRFRLNTLLIISYRSGMVENGGTGGSVVEPVSVKMQRMTLQED